MRYLTGDWVKGDRPRVIASVGISARCGQHIFPGLMKPLLSMPSFNISWRAESAGRRHILAGAMQEAASALADFRRYAAIIALHFAAPLLFKFSMPPFSAPARAGACAAFASDYVLLYGWPLRSRADYQQLAHFTDLLMFILRLLLRDFGGAGADIISRKNYRRPAFSTFRQMIIACRAAQKMKFLSISDFIDDFDVSARCSAHTRHAEDTAHFWRTAVRDTCRCRLPADTRR